MKKTLLFVATLVCSTLANAQSVVNVPEGLTTETWEVEALSLASDNSQWDEVSYTCEVGTAGDKIYIKGLAERFPDAWIEGSISGNTLTISAGQNLGVFTSSSGRNFDIYFSGFDGESTNVIDAQWTYDTKNRSISGDYFVTTAQLSSIYALDVLSEIFLVGPKQNGVNSVMAGADDNAAFNLAGQRLLPSYSTKGITILNGRKSLK